jgi:hypothetical protein
MRHVERASLAATINQGELRITTLPRLMKTFPALRLRGICVSRLP